MWRCGSARRARPERAARPARRRALSVLPTRRTRRRDASRLRGISRTSKTGQAEKQILSAYGEPTPSVFRRRGLTPLTDPTIAVVLVEAEKVRARDHRARRGAWAGACSRSGSAAAGAGAGASGRRPTPTARPCDELGPLPDFDRLTGPGATSSSRFDVNAATNPKVQRARRALAQELRRAGPRADSRAAGRGRLQRARRLHRAATTTAPSSRWSMPRATPRRRSIRPTPGTRSSSPRTTAPMSASTTPARGISSGARQRWQPDADAEIRRLAKRAMRRRFTDSARLDDERGPHESGEVGDRVRVPRAGSTRCSISRRPNRRSPTRARTGTPTPRCSARRMASSTCAPDGCAPRGARTGSRLCTSMRVRPDARSARWDATRSRAILPDDTVRDYFHVATGYSATGDTRCDCWFLANGSGRNGKGTLLQPIRHALGDYALELPGSIFDLRSERSPYELASLPGRRFVTSSESGDTLRLHHDRIKQLTGGDSMNAATSTRRRSSSTRSASSGSPATKSRARPTTPSPSGRGSC